MPPTATIYLSLTPTEEPFGTNLARHLQSRGIGLILSTTITDPVHRAELIQQCTLYCVGISATNATSPVLAADWNVAIAAGKTIVPFVLHRQSDVPPELRSLQWIDFSTDPDSGWLDMLTLLDTLGLVHTPAGTFDWELTLARAYRGRMPYTWRAYRNAGNYYRTLRNSAISSALVIIPIISAFLVYSNWRFAQQIGPVNPQISIAIVSVLLVLLAVRAMVPYIAQARRTDQASLERTEIVVITPDGFGMHSRQGDIVVPYQNVTAIRRLPDASAEVIASINLRGEVARQNVTGRLVDARQRYGATFNDGTTITWSLSRFPQPSIIAAQIQQSYQNTRQRVAIADQSGKPAGARVFISHARRDRVRVDLLDMALQQAGLQTWVDRTMLIGGQAWSSELFQAIADCRVLIVCVSPHALASKVVREEYEYARQLGKPVIAIRLQRGGRMPLVLKEHLHGDFTTGVDQSLRQGLCPLLRAIEEQGVSMPETTREEITPILATATSGRPLPDGWRIFHGRPTLFRLTTIFGISFSIAPLLLAWLAWQSGSGLGIALTIATCFPLLAWLFITYGGLPSLIRPVIATTPTGFVYTSWRRHFQVKYAEIASIDPARAGATLTLRMREDSRGVPVAVFGLFPRGRAIKEQIVRDFKQYHS